MCSIDFTNVKCAIFDLDGTLIDSMPMWHTIGERYLLSKGITPKNGLWDSVKRLTLTETGFYLREQYNLKDCDDKICADINALTFKAYSEEICAKNGAVELLEYLGKKKIPCVLATATHKDCVMVCLERLGMLKYFKSVYSCIDYNTTKKSPYIYQLAADTCECTAAQSVVFEDAVHAGKTAFEAGFNVVAVFDNSALEVTEEPLCDWDRFDKVCHIKINELTEVVKLMEV